MSVDPTSGMNPETNTDTNTDAVKGAALDTKIALDESVEASASAADDKSVDAVTNTALDTKTALDESVEASASDTEDKSSSAMTVISEDKEVEEDIDEDKKEGAELAVRNKPLPKWRRYLMPVSLLLCITALAIVALGIYFSRPPEIFDVKATAAAMANTEADALKRGYVTASTTYHIGDILLNKSGGYLLNDYLPPSALLDNMPSWEFGVITELRDSVRSLRNDFSRAQSQSEEDRDLMEADSRFNFDHTRFMLPSTEGEYRKGLAALERYLNRLQTGEALFFDRTDNLSFYLGTVEKRLGSLSQRLSNSVRESYLRELIHSGENALVEVTDPTAWNEIDNVFFEARGYVWALIHTLRAVQIDFGSILENKNATEMLERIVKKLENTQRSMMSPVVLNSSGFGMLTNHSLVMASYISRANAAIIDLRRLLLEG